MMKRVVYTTEEANTIIDLPKLSLGLSKTKLALLHLLEREPVTMSALALKARKTRAMVYVHLRELKELGFVDEGYRLTEAGRIALL